jgi:hypothetical protein
MLGYAIPGEKKSVQNESDPISPMILIIKWSDPYHNLNTGGLAA